MNLLLFTTDQRDDSGQLTVTGRQHLHLHQTLKVGIGDTLRVGEINGLMGSATVVDIASDSTKLDVVLDKEPPPALQIKLILALPRPKMMRRVLQTVASLGVKELHLINSYKVDKSYWGTPWLEADAIREQLVLGLEQSADTRMPLVYLHKRFKPFVEDELPVLVSGTRALVAHPYTDSPCPNGLSAPVSLAVGPEGGFIPYEVEKLQECHFQPVSLGPRILRVETAIPVLITKLS